MTFYFRITICLVLESISSTQSLLNLLSFPKLSTLSLAQNRIANAIFGEVLELWFVIQYGFEGIKWVVGGRSRTESCVNCMLAELVLFLSSNSIY